MASPLFYLDAILRANHALKYVAHDLNRVVNTLWSKTDEGLSVEACQPMKDGYRG